jgi:hypothetical protein
MTYKYSQSTITFIYLISQGRYESFVYNIYKKQKKIEVEKKLKRTKTVYDFGMTIVED